MRPEAQLSGTEKLTAEDGAASHLSLVSLCTIRDVFEPAYPVGWSGVAEATLRSVNNCSNGQLVVGVAGDVDTDRRPVVDTSVWRILHIVRQRARSPDSLIAVVVDSESAGVGGRGKSEGDKSRGGLHRGVRGACAV